MNREILFRGKRIENGEWVYGSLVLWYDGSISIETGVYDAPMYAVDPATIGQYTGLIDKNGKRIFEGDVMGFDAYGFHYKGVVSFVDGNFCVMCNRPTASPFLDSAIKQHDAICVGNIYDNHELLEGE